MEFKWNLRFNTTNEKYFIGWILIRPILSDWFKFEKGRSFIYFGSLEYTTSCTTEEIERRFQFLGEVTLQAQ